MKPLILTLLIGIITILISLIVIDEEANKYNVKCMEREFAARLKQQDSTYNVMYERVLKGNYKPKKGR